MITLEEKKDISPLCPHCDRPQTTMHFQLVKAFLGKRYVYFCAGCRKIIGISHRKGFFMG